MKLFSKSLKPEEVINFLKENPDFNEIDERLAAGWYVHSGQRKRYLKSIIKDKKE